MQATTQKKLGILGGVAIAAIGIGWWNSVGQGPKVTRYDVAKFLAGSIAVATATEVGSTLYQKHRKHRRESEVLELLGANPQSSDRRQFISVDRTTAIATAPICKSCRIRSGDQCRMCHQSPTDGDFECIDFYPNAPAAPRACPQYLPLYPERRLTSELALRASLQQPIRIRLLQKWMGSREVWLYAPWSDRTDALAFDICLGETPRWENHEGGIRMACTGHKDSYCNVGAREAAVFAWECALAAAIAESQESFEAFWSAPEPFIERFPNPNSYKVEVEQS